MDILEEKEEVKDRIRMIMEREKLTAGAFAENIGVAQATISQILRGRNKYPSTDVILRLHQRYPDISLEWLLTGHENIKGDSDRHASTDGNFVEQENMSMDGNPNGLEKTDGNLETGDLPCRNFNYPLFAEKGLESDERTEVSENRKDLGFERPQNAPKEIIRQEIIYKEKPSRKITEIRIFFDDNTYETFRPEK